MSTTSSIEWTDATWNPVRGCTKISPGCKHCYAETFAERWRGIPGHPYEQGFGLRLVPEKLDEPLKWKKPRRVFVNSMSDLFQDGVPFEFVDKVFAVMALTPKHTYQVLTKRPERMREYLSDPQRPFRIARAIDAHKVDVEIRKTPYAIRPIPGLDKYFADNTGVIWTTHGSAHCVWCGQGFEAAQQDSLYCSQKCRQASAYARKMGRLSEPAGRIMRRVTLDVGEQGHCRVRIIDCDRELVHRLVLRTFDREPVEGEQACHKDGNATRNHICNLRWGTQSDNWEDRIRHGNAKSYAKITREQAEEIRRRVSAGEAAESLGPQFGISGTQARNIAEGLQWDAMPPIPWPLPNCWAGVSVENQEYADKRIPLLIQTPAAKRFVSYEPALDGIALHPDWTDRWFCVDCNTPRLRNWCSFCGIEARPKAALDWVIVGGESGPGARPFDIQWARSMVQQCKAAGVACFVKQLGSKPFEIVGHGFFPNSPGHPSPVNYPKFISRKGGDMAEWPEDLCVREFPKEN